MTNAPQDIECLNHFSRWLEGLGGEARELAALVKDPAQAESVRGFAAHALNYLLKSSDLISSGIEDLGFIEDAFMWRTSARLTRQRDEAAVAGDASGLLARLAAESERVAGFLGELAPHFERRVQSQAAAVVRGRTAQAVLEDAALAEQLCGDVEAWAQSYVPPRFTESPYELVKLRSFFAARLSDA